MEATSQYDRSSTSGSRGSTESAGLENAGPENAGPVSLRELNWKEMQKCAASRTAFILSYAVVYDYFVTAVPVVTVLPHSTGTLLISGRPNGLVIFYL